MTAEQRSERLWLIVEIIALVVLDVVVAWKWPDYAMLASILGSLIIVASTIHWAIKEDRRKKQLAAEAKTSS